MEQKTRLLLIVTLTAVQASLGIPGFLGGEAPLWQRAASYSFFHAGWLHLSVNCVAIWTIYKTCKPCRDLVIPFLIAMAVYPLALRPVIGFSNILYATLGIRTPSLRSRWWRQPGVTVFLAVSVLMLLVPRFSATTHIAAFLLGMGCAALSRHLKEITRDAGRYL